MFEVMREVTVILWASWKFALTFPYAVYMVNMSFMETVLWTNVGGIVGVLFFTYLSTLVIQMWRKLIAPKLNLKHKEKPVFTKRSRLMVKIKMKYGLPGIVILNPVCLSIPVSAFLVTKYYGRKKRYLVWLVFGQAAWSVIYAVFYIYIKNNIPTN